MSGISEWLHENAALIGVFFLFWCAFYLERILRAVHDIQLMMRRDFNERRGLDD